MSERHEKLGMLLESHMTRLAEGSSTAVLDTFPGIDEETGKEVNVHCILIMDELLYAHLTSVLDRHIGKDKWDGDDT